LHARRVDLAEVRDVEARLDRHFVQRGPRVAAQNELAVDEERVRRAPYQNVARGGALEHHPGRGQRPVEEIARAFFVDDLDTTENHRFLLSSALDEDRARVLNANHAQHGRVRGNADAETDENESKSHVFFFGARECTTREDPRSRWEPKSSTIVHRSFTNLRNSSLVYTNTFVQMRFRVGETS
jgi:hypothetical protein